MIGSVALEERSCEERQLGTEPALSKKTKNLTHPGVTKCMKTNMLPKTAKNESRNHSMTHFLKHVD